MTESQFLDGSKTVTRRLGWEFLKAGDRLTGIRKGMGLKKGEKQHVLGDLQVLDARRERLDTITQEDVVREGFPDKTPAEFVEMFCTFNRPCKPDWKITRIEFRRISEEE
jgi:hypothetical protein